MNPTIKRAWSFPRSLSAVEPIRSDSSSYFTKIELTKIGGKEFEKAYEVFHAGFDPKDAKPVGYRLDVTTMAGRTIRLYMFDYFSYGWAMTCSKDAFDVSSRFVMLNLNEDAVDRFRRRSDATRTRGGEPTTKPGVFDG